MDPVTEKDEQSNEQGGIVTTVKKETTDDLDVKAAMDEANDGEQVEPPAKPAEPAKKAAAPEVNSDDDDESVDFKSLSPAQQKAVGKLYRDRRRVDREFNDLKRKVTVLESQLAEKPSGQAAAAPKDSPVEGLTRPRKPNPTEFANDKEFEKAEIKYEDDLFEYRKKLEDVKKQREDAEAEQMKIIENFNTQVVEFKKLHEDYEDVMDQDTPMSAPMFGAVLEEGPALGYYFATHPEEAAKIYKMNERQAYKAILRIVVRIEDEAEKQKADADAERQKSAGKRQTQPDKKPDPPATLSGRGSAAIPRDTSKMSFREREKLMAKENPGEFNYEP